MAQFQQINTGTGFYYLAPPEWTLTALYKWLKQRGYHEFGILGLLGNIVRESSGFPFQYEYSYYNEVTQGCSTYPKLSIDYDAETWSVTNADSFNYYSPMRIYGENIDNGVMSESEFVHQRIDGAVTGFGFMQWSDDELKQRLYNMTIHQNRSIMDLIGQCEVVEATIKNSASQWFAYLNPELTYNPWAVIHDGKYTYEFRGNYPWYTYEEFYNDEHADRIACAFICNYIEKPSASVSSDLQNFYVNNSRYIAGKCWLEFCKQYADRFDHSILFDTKRNGLPIWEYPCIKRRIMR